MSKIIDYLKDLNSKERFFLTGCALGNRKFKLSPAFIKEVNSALNIVIPPDAFAALDYHLDWIYGALQLSTNSDNTAIFMIESECFKASNQDIDFIVAYSEKDDCHVILLEAKGVTAWDSEQMRSKAIRLKAIFGDDGNRWKGVTPHFALVSPRCPQKLTTTEWPKWMVPNKEIPWIKLTGTENKIKLSRCYKNGEIAKKGTCWTIESR